MRLLACGVLAVAGVAVGCGGSASETPPPVEPTTNPRAPYGRTPPAPSEPAPQAQDADDADAADDGESMDPNDAGANASPE